MLVRFARWPSRPSREVSVSWIDTRTAGGRKHCRVLTCRSPGEASVVKLRLKRFGRRHRPFYRLCAMDQRSARDSRAIEELGRYDPIEPESDKALEVNVDRARYWISVGAQPSRTVASLLRRAGVDPTPGAKAS